MSINNTSYDANYFLNLFNEETEEEKRKREEEERRKQEQNIAELIRDEDVELLNYEGKKEKLEPIETTEAVPVPVIPQVKKEEEFNASYFLNQFNAGLIEEPVPEDADMPTVAQRVELGTKLERHTLGNLFRTVKAGLATVGNNKSFQDNIKEIEEERKEKIFQTMKEKYGVEFKEYQDDIATTSGRIITAVADPVTFFIPWAKVAKLGKLGATGVGAGIGAADMALYEYSAYGNVNPNNVLFGATAGGASSLLGSVLANRFKSVEGDEIVVKKVGEDGKEMVFKSSVKDEPTINLTAKETDDLDDVVTKITKEKLPVIKEMEGSLVIRNLYLKARNDQQAYLKAVEDNTKFNPKTNQLEFDFIPQLDVKNKVKLSPTKLKNLKKKHDEATDFLKNDMYDLMEKYAKGQTELIDGTLKTLSTKSQYELTDSLMQKVLYEGFRPLFGGGVGFAAGTFIGDEDDTLNYTLMGAGMTFGFVYNRVKAADYLTAGQKNKAFGLIENESARMLHNFLKVKGSGTTVNRLINHGGELEIIGRNLFHVSDSKYKNIIGAEEASDLMTNIFSKRIFDVVQNATEAERIAATKIITQIKTRAEIKNTKLFNDKQMKNIDSLVANGRLFGREINGYVEGAGVTYKKIDNYDLPQIYSIEKVLADSGETKRIVKEALKAEFPKWDDVAKRKVSDYLDEEVSSLDKAATKISETISGFGRVSMFEGANFSNGRLGNFGGIPQLKNYKKERIFKSLEARRKLEPLLEQDLAKVLDTWVTNTTKGVEFARKFGENGELIFQLERSLTKKYQDGLINKKEYISKIKLLGKSIDAYYGVLHKSATDPFQSNLSKDGFALLTFLSNTTMLPRSIIPTLGDLLQPLQNSDINSALRGFSQAWKKDNIANRYGIGGKGRFGYAGATDSGSTVTKDIEAAFSGVHPTTTFQRTLGEWTKKFFKFNLMAPTTNFADKVAFSTGIDEVFNLAKTIGKSKKISRATNAKLKYYGISKKEIQNLNKFKSIEEALKDEVAENTLVKVGNKGRKRDVLLPGVGNRMLFSQSSNPGVRSIGLFLSWASSKVGQMNGLIQRVEDGDLKLAIKMLGTITIFGGLRELQIMFSPSKEYYEKHEPENFSAKWWGQAMGLSGAIDWRIEKLSRIFSQWAGNSYGSTTGAITPLIGELEKLTIGVGKTVKNLKAGDYEGAGVSTLKTLPLGSELVTYTNEVSKVLTGDELLEDKPNVQKAAYDPVRGYATGGIVRQQYFKGEEVSEDYPVPYAKKNPSDRESDDLGGLTYEEQMNRLGFVSGGPTLVHPENKEYFKKFHNYVMSEGKELTENNKTITMRIIGVNHEGKEYLIPSYDPENKKVLSDEDAKQKYLQDIKSGK